MCSGPYLLLFRNYILPNLPISQISLYICKIATCLTPHFICPKSNVSYMHLQLTQTIDMHIAGRSVSAVIRAFICMRKAISSRLIVLGRMAILEILVPAIGLARLQHIRLFQTVTAPASSLFLSATVTSKRYEYFQKQFVNW